MEQSKIEILLERQMMLMELLLQKQVPITEPRAIPPSIDGIANSIAEFSYDPEANVTFETWFRRYEDLFRVDFSAQDDAWKVRLVLRKLGPAELDKYCNLILPKNPRDRTFDETIKSLIELFGEHVSLFNTRYRCLKLKMNDTDDFLTHMGIVNRECERFKLRSLTDDQFKSLIFICSLVSPRFADIRTRLLNKLEQEPSFTLQAIGDEYLRLVRLQEDSAMIQHGNHGTDTVYAVQQSNWHSSQNSSAKKPPSLCWHCGAWHYARYCPFKQHRCSQCNVTGHKEGFCRSRTKQQVSSKPKISRPFSKPQQNQQRFSSDQPINAVCNQIQCSSAPSDRIAAISTEQYVRDQLTTAVRNLPVTVADIKRTLNDDEVLSEAIRYVQSGWPRLAPQLIDNQLFQRRESLSIVDDCLMFGARVVIPAALRQRVIRQFHAGHPGLNRMKAIARSFAYWPGMDADITEFVRRCTNCQQAAKLPAHATPVPWPRPDKAWSRIHIDFAGPLNGTTYLVLVDAYSKWPEIVPLSPATSSTTIGALTSIFSQHGVPDTIVSDNGSQFTSAHFAEFCKKNAIEHIRTPIYHPQSNGQAERFVDTFKRTMLKSRGEGTTVDNLQRFLLVYRTTPHESLMNSQTPAEALMGRKLRTVNNAMVPKPPQPHVQQHLSQRSFKVGSNVYARDYRQRRNPWIEGKVVCRRGSVMFDIQVGNDVWIRHLNQLRPREGQSELEPAEPVNLPLDLLFDTFQLPSPPVEIPPDIIAPDRALEPRRWTNRRRKTVVPLQVNPKLCRY